MAEAEGTREGGLVAPVEGGVGALETLAPVLAGACRTLVLVHLALFAAVAWGHIHVGIRSHRVMGQAQGQAGTTAQNRVTHILREGHRERNRNDHGSLHQLSIILVLLLV